MRKTVGTKKETTLDQLAQMVAKGFDSIEKRLDNHESIFKTMNLRIDGLEGDVRDIKNSIGPVIRMSAMQDKELSDLKHRVSRLEKLVR